MATVKVISRSSKNKAGKFPVLIEITHNYRRKYKTLFSVKKEHWNDKKLRVKPSHEFHIHLNQAIESELNGYREKIYKLEAKGATYTVEDVFDEKSKTLLSAIDNYMEHARDNISLNAHYKYKALRAKVKKFVKSDPVLSYIDAKWMESFANYLRSDPAISAENTISKYLSQVKCILRHEEVSTDALKVSSTYKRKPKVVLSMDEFEALKRVELPDDWNSLARDTFLFQVYLRGARIADVLQLTRENVVDGHIVYKTMKNNVEIDAEIIPELDEIIQKYSGRSVFLLPVLKKRPADPHQDYKYRKHIEARTVMVNRYIKKAAGKAGIEKHITTHVARHTFALFANNSGHDIKTIQNLLGHSSPTITENYLQETRKASELDKAVHKIFTKT